MPKTALRWAPAKHEKAPLLCRLFGHRWEGGWFANRPYFRQEFKAVDNLETFHVTLTCECDRCGKKSPVGYTHHLSKSAIIGRPYPE